MNLFFSNFVKKFNAIITSDLSFVRLFLMWMMIIMVIDFLLPFNTFNEPQYNIVSKIITEEYFALLLSINILFTSYSLLYNNKINIVVFLFDAVFSCFLWNILFFCLLVSSFSNPVLFPGIFCASLTSWWILIRYPWKLKTQ